MCRDCTEITSYEVIEPRKGGYFVPAHRELIESKVNDAIIDEKRECRQGKINNDKKFGLYYEINIEPGKKRNIDALFVYDSKLWIGEMKGPLENGSGGEPLLKAILEIYTYSQLIKKPQFINDYIRNTDWLSDEIEYQIDVAMTIIIFEKTGESPSKMYTQLYDENSSVVKLMKKLKVYAIKAEEFCKENGKVEFFSGFSPNDY